jgi:phosphoenolpyruvate carboxykinase (ATP)
VAEAVPELDDAELLQPRRLYEQQGRLPEYREIVDRLKAERVAHLEGFPELTPQIVKAVG